MTGPRDWRVVAEVDNALQQQADAYQRDPTPERFGVCRALRDAVDHWPMLFPERGAEAERISDAEYDEYDGHA